MRKKKLHISVFPIIILILLLPACTRAASTKPNYPIGGVWDVPVEDGDADWEAASALAQEQHAGFLLANEDVGFDAYTFSEGNRQDDVQTAVRSMVEGQAKGANEAVAAILGATSNEATTRAVALANFFKVPMLVPNASGDNLLSDTNLWAFQLSPSNSEYTDHLIRTVLNKQIVYKEYEEGFEPEFRIAVLYEQNTYGESAAVSAATFALEESYSIVLYDKFPAQNPSAARLRALVNMALDEDAQMVLIIASDPAVALSLTETFTEMSSEELRPILVGIAAGFTSQKFTESDLLESVYVISQQVDGRNCPAAIDSLYAAQNYAAVNLLTAATENVNTAASNAEKKISLNLTTSAEKLALYRENLRDALKAADQELPCLGQVAFDNGGHNKFLRFEIITAEEGKKESISAADFVEIIKKKIDLTSIQ